MKKLFLSLLILFSLQLSAQNLYLNKGITADSLKTVINMAIRVKSESCMRNRSASMTYLRKGYSMLSLRSTVNTFYDTINRYFPSIALSRISFGMTGASLRNTWNANIDRINSGIGYQVFPIADYRLNGQKGKKKIGTFNGDTLRMSLNGGLTWPIKKKLALADSVNFAYVFDNGTILVFCERPKIYRSTDNLRTISEIPLKARTGGNYVYHTPVNPLYPGDYFTPLTGVTSGTISGKEVMVFGNYLHSTSRNGRAPTNIYYSVNGDSVKVAYTFYPNSCDDGTPGGGVISESCPGLGDLNSPWRAHHVHDVEFDEKNQAWWVVTGDEPSSNPSWRGIHWIRGTYNLAADSWNWQEMIYYPLNGLTYENAPQYKCAGLVIEGDSITWAADVDPVTPENTRFTGIWRCHINDLADTTKTRHMWTNNGSLVGLEKNGNTWITSGYGGKDLYVSFDNAETWRTITLNTNDFTAQSYFKRFHLADDNGYFMIQGQYRNYYPTTSTKSLLFKPLP